jgi:hypothetical protein
MRIRSTKPEFWRSERIASVSWDARLVLKGLESYVDDNGVGKDDLALIVGDCFSRDMLAKGSETVARVSEAISELHQAGLVWRYEAEGTALLFISFWESIQRIDKPGKGRLRRPDGTLDYKESEIRECVASPRESVAPGTGEQGNRAKGTGHSAYGGWGRASRRTRARLRSPHRTDARCRMDRPLPRATTRDRHRPSRQAHQDADDDGLPPGQWVIDLRRRILVFEVAS